MGMFHALSKRGRGQGSARNNFYFELRNEYKTNMWGKYGEITTRRKTSCYRRPAMLQVSYNVEWEIG